MPSATVGGMKRTPLSLFFAAALSAVLSALLAAAGMLAFSPPASALPAVGHGIGYLWGADARSWLGSHRLADGQLGLCLQVQNAPPEGSDLQYGHASTAGWFGGDDLARLAYIGRWWAGSTNPARAAAAQLVTWGITGLNGHDEAWYAQRANAASGEVLRLAEEMRAQLDAPGGASRGVVARLSLAVPSEAGGTVSSDLVVDYVGGGPATLPRATHRGTLTLSGATFADGSTVKDAANGERYAIVPSKGTALNRVTADIAYTDLPFGADAYIARAPAGIQSLLVPPARNTGARARAHAGDVSPLPFHPAVVTQTSAAEAVAGAHLSDTLVLKLAPAPKVVREGAAAGSAGSARSAGPAGSAGPEVPAELAAPSASVPAASAAGEAPTVRAEAAGSAAAESAASPGDAASPGVAASPAVDAPTVRAEAAGPAGVPTSLDEWGVYRDADGALQPVPVVVRSTLWGPLDEAPDRQSSVPPHTPSVCTVSTRAEDGPGEYETPDCVLPSPGYYVWTETIDPADTPEEKGGERFTAWASPFGAASEVTRAIAPPPVTPTPTPTPTPPTPTPPAAVTPPATPPATPSTPGTAGPQPTAPGGVLPPSSSSPAPGGSRSSSELASTGLAVAGVPLWAASIALGSGVLMLALLFVLVRGHGRGREHPQPGHRPAASTGHATHRRRS